MNNLEKLPYFYLFFYSQGYDGAPRSFIATQGPLVNTVNDFWATIWQERCPCIVMMTKLKEKNKLQQTKVCKNIFNTNNTYLFLDKM